MNRFLGFTALIVLVGGALFFLFINGPVPEAEEAPSAAVTTRTIDEDTDQYRIDVEYPHFNIAAFDAATAAAITKIADEVRVQSAEDVPVDEGFRKYELLGNIDKTYLDEKIASARVTLGQDFGGAHPLPVVLTFNYDRESGREIDLAGALELVGMTLEEVAVGAKEQLNENQNYSDMLIAPEGAEAKAENYRTFFVDGENVTFVFQAYQVAAYAAGTPEVSFPRVK